MGMINKKAEVFSALKTIEGVSNVFFNYPESFKSLPCLSYRELYNKPLVMADDEEYFSELLFAVDIWEETSISAGSTAIKVDEVMQAIGLIRVASEDVYEEGAAAHKSMKYKYIGG